MQGYVSLALQIVYQSVMLTISTVYEIYVTFHKTSQKLSAW